MTGMEAMIIGSVFQAAGQLKAGSDAKKAANYNAQVAANNAVAARLAAAEDAKREGRLSGKRQGANRAQDPDKLDLLEDNALEEELALQSIIHGGEVQGVGFTNNAQLEKSRGKAAASGAAFGAASTLLGAAGKAGAFSSAPTPGLTELDFMP